MYITRVIYSFIALRVIYSSSCKVQLTRFTQRESRTEAIASVCPLSQSSVQIVACPRRRSSRVRSVSAVASECGSHVDAVIDRGRMCILRLSKIWTVVRDVYTAKAIYG